MMKHVADALGSTPAGDLAASDDEAATDPDAALIELGVEYERLLAIEKPLRAELHRLDDMTARLRYEKMGLDPEDPEARRAATNERWGEWMAARDLAGKEIGYDKAWDKMNRAWKKTARIGRKIHKIKPTTVAGLLVRVRVIETHDEIFRLEPDEQLLIEIKGFAKGVSRCARRDGRRSVPGLRAKPTATGFATQLTGTQRNTGDRNAVTESRILFSAPKTRLAALIPGKRPRSKMRAGFLKRRTVNASLAGGGNASRATIRERVEPVRHQARHSRGERPDPFLQNECPPG